MKLTEIWGSNPRLEAETNSGRMGEKEGEKDGNGV